MYALFLESLTALPESTVLDLPSGDLQFKAVFPGNEVSSTGDSWILATNVDGEVETIELGWVQSRVSRKTVLT